MLRPGKRKIVTLEFLLHEEVTPDIFAARVAEACGEYSTLREGEAVRPVGSAYETRVGKRGPVEILGMIVEKVSLGRYRYPSRRR